MVKNSKQLKLFNATAEFLVFSMQERTNSVEVIAKDETLWLSVKMMAQLFECTTDNIYLHLKNIFETKELNEEEVTEFFSVTAADGKKYNTKHYNLDVAISIGYRVNSYTATKFRQWATSILREYTIKGFVLDDKRLKNGVFFEKDYFKELLARIREIRASERRFYQKITDIYATAVDYSKEDELTKEFFATVQNKLHFAIHNHTAAELIVKRADASKENMGLTTWRDAPDGKIQETDVVIAKNYLSEEEIDNLNRIVTMYLDYAEMQANKNIPMTMADWVNKLNAFLQFNEREILTDAGRVSSEFAKQHALTEFEKYRIVQDRVFVSDFDKSLLELENISKKNSLK